MWIIDLSPFSRRDPGSRKNVYVHIIFSKCMYTHKRNVHMIFSKCMYQASVCNEKGDPGSRKNVYVSCNSSFVGGAERKYGFVCPICYIEVVLSSVVCLAPTSRVSQKRVCVM